MPDIVLTSLNAKYIHAAFGLRYLLANLGPLQARASLCEFDISQRPIDIVEALLAQSPKILGVGVYIWNVTQSTELVSILRRLRPDVVVVLGGPEVSYEQEGQRIVELADYVIPGEADTAFAGLCEHLLAGERPAEKVLPARLPDFDQLRLPYDLYTQQDIEHRVLYVEASRGCPFSCEFCLSSLDIPVRQAPLGVFLQEIGTLLDRGAKQLKFVDRTFNLDERNGRAILEFLLARWQPGSFFHFEMVPDRLPLGLREVIEKFPAGALQFEVGVQTFNPEVAARISRRQNYSKLEDNLRHLRAKTGVHIHADLIAGLPGESLQSFASGFDRLVGLEPHEIQVGILKRLRGTPITRHDDEFRMRYNPHPAYEILENSELSFGDVQRLRRFARYWDLVGNSGNFVESVQLIWREAGEESVVPCLSGPFGRFLRFSDWLFQKVGRTEGVALARLMRFVFEYLTEELRVGHSVAAQALWADYKRGGRKDKPLFLRDFLPISGSEDSGYALSPLGPKRQARHLAANPKALSRETSSEDSP